MNLRDLEYLVAVADHRSFRQAAAACGVSQPTLSIQVKKLEAELGAVLVDREASPLALTPAGAETVRRARSLLLDAAELRAAVAGGVDPEGGQLRLGVFPTLGAYLLPHVLAGVRERFSGLELLVTEKKTSTLLAMLDEGKLDAALVALPVRRPGLTVRPLFHEDFLLAVPAGHDLASASPVTPAELTGEEMLIMAEGHCLGDQVGSWMATIGARERQDHKGASLESVRNMVVAGSGMTLLPAMSVEPPVPPTPGMVVRSFADPAPGREIALVWRANSSRDALLERLAPALVPQGVGGVDPRWEAPGFPEDAA